MARLDDARNAMKALAKYTDALAEATLEHGGVIYDTPDNRETIQALRHHQLVFHLDEDLPHVQVSRVVGDLMAHVTQSYQRQASSGAVSDLVRELQNVVESYFVARDNGATDDASRKLIEAQEVIASLINTLQAIVVRFTHYIHNRFSTVSDIDLRILENRRALDEAGNINRLLDTLTPSYLMQLARFSRELQYLLTKILARSLSRLRANLVDALHRLTDNLAKLQNDKEVQRQNHVIDAWLQHYERNPRYTPGEDILDEAHGRSPSLFRVEPLEIRAHPAIDDPSQREELDELAENALRRLEPGALTDSNVSTERVEVIDQRGAEEVEPEDPLEHALEWFFEALPTLVTQQPISAIDAYYKLDVEEPLDFWMLALWESYNMRLENGEVVVPVELTERQMGTYDGTRLVEDIVFSLERHHAA
ncbi:hypothetical protein RSO68_02630 [Halomonas saccharevitans]|uniref:Uncharacterized protein n=1 Tax=Halomonas saccharevitans TaxID=416872 RepID=A0ABU3NAX8_9GAMM|nr:hypothetical protein [Halomonas saccharevitans]MDT8878360.1 hypothetical protein [Halomonas saccharevitans]